MTIQDLQPNECHPYYRTYIDKAEGLELVTGFKESGKNVVALLSTITVDNENYSYAEGKWTIKELVQHVIDVERIFAYRALRIGRNDTTELPGFEQDDYISASDLSKRSLASLIEEFKVVRASTEFLFSNFTIDQLQNLGKASGSVVSVRALGFIIIGHEIHHCEILRERYL